MPITQQCAVTGNSFIIRDEDVSLLEKISPVIDGKKQQLPLPSLCPSERLRRRMIWRNEQHLYRRTCDATNKSIISTYTPDNKLPVYDQSVWRSDGWDAKKYGRDFDFSRSFFEQFAELQQVVPHMNMILSHCENCEYAPFSFKSKDSYMCVSVVNSERILYSYQTNSSFDCVDCALCYDCEHCYECVYGKKLYHCFWTRDCQESNDLFLCVDCQGCDHCINCSGLKNMSYCVNNQQVTQEEYDRAYTELHSYPKKTQEQYRLLMDTDMRNYLIGSEDCVGNHLYNCKQAYKCFEAENLENCTYCFPLPQGATSCFDIHYSPGAELVYDSLSACNDYQCGFVLSSWDVKHAWYVEECYFSQHLFGCVGLKHAQYCILNKQYTKEEYERLVPRIIAHMQSTGDRGEFFPASMSHYSYNETLAHNFFLLTKGEVEEQGLRWSDMKYQTKIPVGSKPVLVKNIGSIRQYDLSILREIFVCETSGRPYNIVKQELLFYEKHQLPLPHLHPHVRQQQRLEKRNKQFTSLS